jgi:hypothetical protein
MGFVLEEWVEATKPREYRTYPVFGVGPFKTREEAHEEAKRHEPKHGGFITAVPEPREENPASMSK